MWSCIHPEKDVIGPTKNDDVIIIVSLIACLGGTGTNPVGKVELELCPLQCQNDFADSCIFQCIFL